MVSVAVHTYRVEHDVGLAPNPFGGFCTLAVCKPRIRRAARPGDLIVGMSSAAVRRPTNARAPVYVMRVKERLHFDEYWADPRFARKRPNPLSGLVGQAGDNIYHHDGTGWYQALSWHSRPNGEPGSANLQTDTSTSQHVLIGREFAYWGYGGPELPEDLLTAVKSGIGENRITDTDVVAKFITWAQPHLGLGQIGWPQDWQKQGQPLRRVLASPARALG